MKKLISLISTKGKTPEQAAKELFEAVQKFQKVNSESQAKLAKKDK